MDTTDKVHLMIRMARPDDAVCIADLCGQLGYPTTTDSVRERLAVIGRDKRSFAKRCEGAKR